jgi:peptidyl-prolyl cis-trans isomerase SurA
MIFMKKLCSKMILKYINKIALVAFLLVPAFGFAQPKVIDQVIAVVGNNIILQSELEAQFLQMKQQAEEDTEDIGKCNILEDLLFQKLLLHQAQIDSVVVNDNQVDTEMSRRLEYFIRQIGSEKKLEEYYGKSINEIKDEFRIMVKNQLLIQQVQGKITGGLAVTPSEVKSFFNKIPKDSLPYINSELEIGQIVLMPVISEEAKIEARRKVEEFRERIVEKKATFITLATLYSEDPGSARKGGELGFVERGSFVPEFEAVAFRLKEGQVSDVVETNYGYHILELIERRGEKINIRHILISPKISQEDMLDARLKLDTIRSQIMSNDTLGFTEAAALYSDDKESKYNGGLLINPQTGTKRWEADQIDPSLFFAVDKLKVGEISQPLLVQMPGGKQGYRILMLKTRTEPHVANLKDDYQRLQDAALNEKQHVITNKWIEKKLITTYYRISEDFKDCQFESFKVNTIANKK